MYRTLRLALVTPLCVVAFLLPLWLEQPSAQGQDKDTPYVQRRKLGKCLCHTGQASWQYLRAPMRVPADPPRCGLILAKGDCKSRARPKGTGGNCWGSQKEECFWKRHAYSWDIQCSVCFEESECTSCDKMIGKPDPKVAKMLKQQLKTEGHDGRKRKLFLAVTPHFYVITDLDRKVKVKTDGGAPRVMSGHEFVHLFAERCERAYNDFVHYFKGGSQQWGKMGVYLMRKQRTAEGYAHAYLGSANTDMLYGGSNNGKIAGGFCFNGFVGSYQENGSDDDLHAYCRHMIGHILFSTWLKVNGKEKYCPKWAFIGVAHFMEKLLEPHKDYATYCAEETTAPSGSGADWDKKARKLAHSRLDPIESFFGRKSSAQFKYKDHIRAWSLMHLGLMEDNDRWIEVLKHLRHGNDEGYAFKEGLGLSPDQFHHRWVDRLTGKRPTLGEIKKDSREDPDAPGRRERELIKQTQDAEELAGRIRGVHSVNDVRLLKVILNRMDHESDLVRESIQIVLERTTDEVVLEALANEGPLHKKKMTRAGVARALGALRYELARPALEALLKDSFWLARANAALALQTIGKKESLEPLVAALGDKHEKAWIAIADAVASFKERNKDATLKTIPRIDHRAWQVRVTACQALANYGTDDCMDALIRRFGMEKGRLEKEFRRTLKAVSRDDLGPKASTWLKWWKEQKEQFGGLDPNAPPMPTKEDEERYGLKKRPDDEAHYYGKRIFSKAVGFVFDTSASMDKNIKIPAAALSHLGNIPTAGTRMQVAKEVLAGAIKKLHPMTRFNLVFFSSNVRPWKKRLVPAGAGNKNGAESAIRAAPSEGETNIHGALKAALGLHEKPSLHAHLDDIPDTVYFLTDGSPTRGEITGTPELLGWFQDINRFGKVKLHVIAFGTLGVDLDFLRGLANIGGGDFIHVPEER